MQQSGDLPVGKMMDRIQIENHTFQKTIIAVFENRKRQKILLFLRRKNLSLFFMGSLVGSPDALVFPIRFPGDPLE